MLASFIPSVLLRWPTADATATDVVVLSAQIYGWILLVYVAECSLVTWINNRHPERFIQKKARRHVLKLEILHSLWTLAWVSGYTALGMTFRAKGWGVFGVIEPTWWSIAGGMVISLVVYDTWFYWGHRFEHTDLVYARVHRYHHKSVTPTPWSNNSDSFLGAFIEQSYFLWAGLFMPVPVVVILLHKVFDQVTGIIGHAGYEYTAGATARKPWPLLCTTFHDQHHGFIKYNFANTFSWWDRAMGTCHPTYDETVRKFENLGKQPMA